MVDRFVDVALIVDVPSVTVVVDVVGGAQMVVVRSVMAVEELVEVVVVERFGASARRMQVERLQHPSYADPSSNLRKCSS